MGGNWRGGAGFSLRCQLFTGSRHCQAGNRFGRRVRKGGRGGKALGLARRVSERLDVVSALPSKSGRIDLGLDATGDGVVGFVDAVARVDDQISLFANASLDNHKKWQAIAGLRIEF